MNEVNNTAVKLSVHYLSAKGSELRHLKCDVYVFTRARIHTITYTQVQCEYRIALQLLRHVMLTLQYTIDNIPLVM
jgi:hypothetical protein